MVKAYFCWETSVGNRWVPVIYSSRPNQSLEKRGQRSEVYEVEVESYENMSPTAFVKQYPAPAVAN